MNLLGLLLKTSRVRFILAAVSGIFSGGSSAALIALINVSLQQFGNLPGWVSWGFLGLSLLLLFSVTASQYLLAELAQTVVYELRLKLTRQILAAPLRHLETLGVPKLLASLTEDIEAIANASAALSALGINFALLIGCLAYLCWLSWPLFLFVASCLGLSMYLVQQLMKQGYGAFRQARKIQDILFQHFQGVTAGIKELKLNQRRRQAFLDDALIPTIADYRYQWVKGMTMFSWASGIGLALLFLPLGMLLFVLPRFQTLPVALIGSYALTILFCLTPLRNILIGLPQLNQANIALLKLQELGFSLNSQVHDATATSPPWRSLHLEDITHTYQSDDHPFTLGPLQFTLTPGELVFIVGGNGSGKSTLVKLLCGLYKPESGQIYLDGQPIGDRERETYRQLFSAVFADFYLFEQLMGLDATERTVEIQTYLQQLELAKKVEVQDGRLSTLALSQGQRKRLALLTAYLEDRPIYIFDEWASDQDPIFKTLFYRELLPALKQRGKAVLVISHDDRYFDIADRLIKLDYGKIVHSSVSPC